MKSLLAVLALLASFQASAFTLLPTDCGTLRQCLDVPNDGNVTVSVYGPTSHPWMWVTITTAGDPDHGIPPVTTSYYAPTPVSGDQVGLVMQSATLNGQTGQIIYTGLGSITFSGTWTTRRTCTKYCVTHWTLTGGSIQ